MSADQQALSHKIDARDGEWCVVSPDGSREFGCFPSEAEARARLKEIEALAKNDQNDEVQVYEDLRNVDIFRVGEWNGRKFSRQDLDDMVAAFDKVGYRVPIKLGHREANGERAYGWVTNLRRIGDKLVADLTDIPKQVFDVIKERGFDAVSAEIFMNLKRNGEMFRRALKAVALLGAEIPAVSGLRNLRENLNFAADDVLAFTLTTEQIMSDIENKAADDSAEKRKDGAEDVAKLTAELDAEKARVAELSAKLKDESEAVMKVAELKEQVEALTKANTEAEERRRRERIDQAVANFRIPVLRNHMRALLDLATKASDTVKFQLAEDEEAKDVDAETVVRDLMKRLDKHTERLFTELATHGDLKRDDVPADEDPGTELDRLAKAYMAKHNESDYGVAFHAVLNDPENAELKRLYGERS